MVVFDYWYLLISYTECLIKKKDIQLEFFFSKLNNIVNIISIIQILKQFGDVLCPLLKNTELWKHERGKKIWGTKKKNEMISLTCCVNNRQTIFDKRKILIKYKRKKNDLCVVFLNLPPKWESTGKYVTKVNIEISDLIIIFILVANVIFVNIYIYTKAYQKVSSRWPRSSILEIRVNVSRTRE